MSYINFALLIVFFCSGLASLTLQTIWIRVLSLSVGSTSTAMGIILALFFGGLGIGGYLGGKYSGRIKNHLKVYAIIEVVVGLYGLFIFYPLNNFHYLLRYLAFDGNLAWLNPIMKFSLVATSIVGPAIGMGLTLPILVRFVNIGQKSAAKTVSLLYGINTLGAVAGAFMCSYLFIPYLGVDGANFFAVAIYFILAGLIYWLHLNYGEEFSLEMKTFATHSIPHTTVKPSSLFLAVAFVTGFSAIGFEVIWAKYLTVFLGTNIFGIGIVLSLFLLGIATGSLIVGRWIDHFENLKKSIGISLVFTALVCILVTWFLNDAPKTSLILQVLLKDVFEISNLTAKSIVSGLIMFPATVMFGIMFPLIVKAMTREASSMSLSVGRAYAVNTLGSIIASLGLGLYVLPTFGSRASSIVAVLPLLTIGLAIWWQFTEGNWSRLKAIGAGGILVAAVLMVKPDFTNILKSAYFDYQNYKSIPEVISAFADREEFVKIVEGKTAITSLSYDPSDGANYRDFLRLKTNGLNESVYETDQLEVFPKYEALLGLLPYLFSKDVHSSFVVGYGGGYTVDFMSQTSLKKVQVAELEKGIMDAADYVHHNDNPILKRSNVEVQIEDARFVLATKQRGPFDIVVSQPSHSWLSGVANLFTSNYFEIVSENLTQGGVFGQWLNLYNIDPVSVQSILKTFYSVFEYGAVFTNPEDQELIMIGSHEPLVLKSKRFEKLVSANNMKHKLQNIPVNSIYDALSLYAMSREEVMNKFDKVPLNTDLNAYAEVRQSRLFYSNSRDLDAELNQFFTKHYPGDVQKIARTLGYNQLSPLKLFQSYYTKEQYEKLRMLTPSIKMTKAGTFKEKKLKGELLFKVREFKSSVSEFKELMVQAPSSEILDWIFAGYEQLQDYRQTLEAMSKYPAYVDTQGLCYGLHAAVKAKAKSTMDQILNKLMEDEEESKELCGEYFDKVVGLYYFNQKQIDQALAYFEEYYAVDPQDQEVVKHLAEGYALAGSQRRSQEFKDYLEQLQL